VAEDPSKRETGRPAYAPTLDLGEQGAASGGDDLRAVERGLERGASLDRFIVIERLGAGGMGMVVSAYDPDLDRKVAIKVLRPDKLRKGSATDGQQRLLREARALAKLSHPNVTTVYEIGTVGSRVFIAMEYVAGHSMSDWLRECPRDWREVVDMMVQSGRGLLAAHRAGLVHRDFKPENVLIGTDGRARVTDFGLVGIEDTAVSEDSGEFEINRSLSLSLSSTLTVAGALMGTPRYMSPEQHHRQKADARSDQFGFCAVLYEALYDQTPFAGDSYWGLASNVSAGKIRQPPKDAEVPAWLWEVARRGMSRDPEDRFSSMEEVLEALQRDRTTTRRRRLALAGGVVGFVALSGLAAAGFLRGTDSEHEPCRGARAELSGVWDVAVAGRLEAAFATSTKPYAAETQKTVRGLLDDYAAAWVEMRTEVCEATHVRGTQSAALLDARMMCLDDRRSELGALAELFARADDRMVQRAVKAASKLRSLDACANVRALAERAPPPDDPEVRARIAAIRERLSEARALSATGGWKAALAVVQAVEDGARDIGYAPLAAETLLLRGSLQESLGDHKEAERAITDAAMAALAARDDAVAIRASAQLVMAVGYRLGRYSEAELWGRHALAMVERGGGNPTLEAKVQETMAMLRTGQGEYQQAKEHAQRAYDLRRERLGADHPMTANAQHTLGVILGKTGDFDGALSAYENVLRIHTRTLGERHPNVPMSLHNIGVIHKRKRDYERAEDYLHRALTAWTEVLPANHPNIGMALLNLGVVQQQLGRFDDAIASLRRSRQIKEARLGADHPRVAKVTLAIGAVWKQRGEPARALDLQEKALAVYLAALGEDHPEVGEAIAIVAATRNVLGQHIRAAAEFRRALTIREAKLGPDHPTFAPVLLGLGKAELARGSPGAAVPALERAEALREKQGDTPIDSAETRFFLAQAMWASGGDRDKARRSAQKALDAYRDGGAAYAEHRQQVERWLAKH